MNQTDCLDRDIEKHVGDDQDNIERFVWIERRGNVLIEFDEVCKSCKGTGLYVGMGERDGSAVVCHTCNGTGCHHFKYEYEKFVMRKNQSRDIKRVYEVNPGICIGSGNGYLLSEFGGMPIKEWEAGLPFPEESENRNFTCPAWWYQSANYKLKPSWNECIGCGSFSGCEQFKNKDKCWKKWDEEYRNKLKEDKK